MADNSNAGNALTSFDFSKQAISRAVLLKATTNPVFAICTAVGVVGLTGLVAGAALPAVLLYPMVGGLACGGAAFAVNFFARRDTIAAQYLQEINLATRDQSKRMAASLKEEFTELGYDAGKKQIELLLVHLETIKQLLEKRFDKGDVSYEQFLGPAERLVANTLNVLKDAAAQLRANNTYDQERDRKATKTRGVAGTGVPNGDSARRKQLYDKGIERFNTLIASVESAITGLAELTHDVAHIGSDTGSHEDFIKRVREIASTAGLYVDEKRI